MLVVKRPDFDPDQKYNLNLNRIRELGQLYTLLNASHLNNHYDQNRKLPEFVTLCPNQVIMTPIYNSLKSKSTITNTISKPILNKITLEFIVQLFICINTDLRKLPIHKNYESKMYRSQPTSCTWVYKNKQWNLVHFDQVKV